MDDSADTLQRFQRLLRERAALGRYFERTGAALDAVLRELRDSGVTYKDMAFAECDALGLTPELDIIERACGRYRTRVARSQPRVTVGNTQQIADDRSGCPDYSQEVIKMQRPKLIKRTVTEEYFNEALGEFDDGNVLDDGESDALAEEEHPVERLQPRRGSSRQTRR